MRKFTSGRGFNFIMHPEYLEPYEDRRLVSESSAINTEAHAGPGGDYLWIGEHHHLDHEQVAELRDALTHWLDKGRLPSEPAGR